MLSPSGCRRVVVDEAPDLVSVVYFEVFEDFVQEVLDFDDGSSGSGGRWSVTVTGWESGRMEQGPDQRTAAARRGEAGSGGANTSKYNFSSSSGNSRCAATARSSAARVVRIR